MNIVQGHDARVIEWASQLMDGEIGNPQVAHGVIDKDGSLIGALIYGEYDGHNVEMSFTGTRGFTPSVLKFIFEYPFNELKCGRMWARIRKSNKKMKKLLPRVGFKFEGVERKYYKDEDALRFSMLANECKWIKANGIKT